MGTLKMKPLQVTVTASTSKILFVTRCRVVAGSPLVCHHCLVKRRQTLLLSVGMYVPTGQPLGDPKETLTGQLGGCDLHLQTVPQWHLLREQCVCIWCCVCHVQQVFLCDVRLSGGACPGALHDMVMLSLTQQNPQNGKELQEERVKACESWADTLYLAVHALEEVIGELPEIELPVFEAGGPLLLNWERVLVSITGRLPTFSRDA